MSVVDGVLEVWTLVVYQKMDIPRKLKHLENYHLLSRSNSRMVVMSRRSYQTLCFTCKADMNLGQNTGRLI